MNRFKISVITPSLNKAMFLENNIQSVLNQGYDNFEHIIVDGRSTDQTIEIITKYSHLKWISEPDTGQSDAMNKGFNMSSGDIIVYLNADDYFSPNAFNTVLPYFCTGAKFVVGKVKVIRDDNSFSINDPKTDLKDMLKWWENDSYCCNPVGYFYRREIQDKIGGFNILNHYSMDFEFLLEAACIVNFVKIEHVLGGFRLVKGAKTLNVDEKHIGKYFTFCDKFLGNFDPKYINDYKLKRNERLSKASQNESIKNISKRLNSYHFLNVLLRRAVKIPYGILNYLKNHFI